MTDLPAFRFAWVTHEQENVPTEQPKAQEATRVPRADEVRQGAARAETPPGKRQEKIDRLVAAPTVEPGKARLEETFTPQDRLHRRREFDAAYSRGVRIPGRNFTLFILPNNLGHSRLGMVVSRKVGNAVVRNRVRRGLRQIFRTRREALALESSFDIVVQSRPSIAQAQQDDLEEDFLSSVARFKREWKRGK